MAEVGEALISDDRLEGWTPVKPPESVNLVDTSETKEAFRQRTREFLDKKDPANEEWVKELNYFVGQYLHARPESFSSDEAKLVALAKVDSLVDQAEVQATDRDRFNLLNKAGALARAVGMPKKEIDRLDSMAKKVKPGLTPALSRFLSRAK